MPYYRFNCFSCDNYFDTKVSFDAEWTYCPICGNESPRNKKKIFKPYIIYEDEITKKAIPPKEEK